MTAPNPPRPPGMSDEAAAAMQRELLMDAERLEPADCLGGAAMLAAQHPRLTLALMAAGVVVGVVA